MSKNINILLVEDSKNDAILILRELVKQGYQPVCEQVETAREMVDALNKKNWDIMIADYVLPGFSGLDALKILQDAGLDIPCIITSGRIDEEIAVAAMKAGAKDYVMKDNLKRLGPAVERELAENQERLQRRKIQQAFQQNEAKLSVVLERMPCILWTTDANLILTSLLGAGLKYFDFEPNTLIGKSMTEALRKARDMACQPSVKRLKAYPRLLKFCLAGGCCIASSSLCTMSGVIPELLDWLLDVTDKRHAEIELRSLSHKLVATQEIERRNIARELHDQIGQSLTVLKLMIGQAGRSNAEKASPILSEALGVVSELIRQVREMSLRLRPSMLDDLGLLPTLLWHFERFSKQSGININFGHDGLDRQLSPEINTAGYRIVQEALTNVARYANVSEVDVRVQANDEFLFIEIEDRGSGFDPAKLVSYTSTGISGLRERVNLLGGKLTIETTQGKGTCLMVQIPLHSGSAQQAEIKA